MKLGKAQPISKQRKGVGECGEEDAAKAMFVGVRIRPLSEQEKSSNQSSCCEVIDGKVVAIKKSGNASEYLKSQNGSLHEYGFDAAFDEQTTQYEVYSKTTKPFLGYVLTGINVTVFAYGATGAGKTHTLMGNARCDDAAAHADAGIIPNAICDLFQHIEKKRKYANVGESWSMIMNYIEVYNEQVYDLLENSGSRKVLSLREDPDKGMVIVAGVTDKIVNNAEEVLDLLQLGNKNRSTEATMANAVSSRSHAVLQIFVKYTQRNERGNQTFTESKLSLIDLAGSERASQTNNRGVRLQEGASINRSLLALANCINALATTKKGNVKYRDSKLTHLLKSSLEGNCKLIMIANINPSNLTFEDSHNTLKYANRAKNIKLNPVAMEQKRDNSWLERETRLRTENTDLRKRVTSLEELVSQLRHELQSKGIHSVVTEDSENNIPEINHTTEKVNQELELIRAQSPTAIRQLKNAKINRNRRRSSDCVPLPEEVHCQETKVRSRKNRASICAEVMSSLLTLPVPINASTAINDNKLALKDMEMMDIETDDVETSEESCATSIRPALQVSLSPPDVMASIKKSKLLRPQTPSKIPNGKKRVIEEEIPTEHHPETPYWKSMFSDTMLADGLFAASTSIVDKAVKSQIPVSTKKIRAPTAHASTNSPTNNSPSNSPNCNNSQKRMKLNEGNDNQTLVRQESSPSVCTYSSTDNNASFTPMKEPSKTPPANEVMRESSSPIVVNDLICMPRAVMYSEPQAPLFSPGISSPNPANKPLNKKRRGSLLPRPRAKIGITNENPNTSYMKSESDADIQLDQESSVCTSNAGVNNAGNSNNENEENGVRRSARISSAHTAGGSNAGNNSTTGHSALGNNSAMSGIRKHVLAINAAGGSNTVAGNSYANRRKSVTAVPNEESKITSATITTKVMELMNRVTGSNTNNGNLNTTGIRKRNNASIVPNMDAEVACL